MNKHIGKSYDKVDYKGILSGKPSYTGDFVPKDALVIKVLRSPHAQARIKSIDTSKAKLIPGVEAIFTHEDVPNTRFTLAGQTSPACRGSAPRSCCTRSPTPSTRVARSDPVPGLGR